MYLKYFWYIVKHKWFVMIECFRVGLFWRGLVHDLSKLFPSEFFPYANYFYGKKEKEHKLESGYYKPATTEDRIFDFAWLLHQKRNRHHWQWWILPEDEGGVKVLSIEEPYLTEMVCDWVGAEKAQGRFPLRNDRYSETRKWYQENGKKMQLSEETRREIEKRFQIGE